MPRVPLNNKAIEAIDILEKLSQPMLEEAIDTLYCRFYDAYITHPEIDLLYDYGEIFNYDFKDWDEKPTRWKIDFVAILFTKVLKKKNEKYGDSALNPNKIFSKLEADNSILIRLDDKMNRIINADELRLNDFFDVMGYMWLYILTKPEWLARVKELID